MIKGQISPTFCDLDVSHVLDHFMMSTYLGNVGSRPNPVLHPGIMVYFREIIPKWPNNSGCCWFFFTHNIGSWRITKSKTGGPTIQVKYGWFHRRKLIDQQIPQRLLGFKTHYSHRVIHTSIFKGCRPCRRPRKNRQGSQANWHKNSSVLRTLRLSTFFLCILLWNIFDRFEFSFVNGFFMIYWLSWSRRSLCMSIQVRAMWSGAGSCLGSCFRFGVNLQ